MPSVAIDKITVGRNRRPLKEEKVTELMESIKANGLLNPITIDQEFNLIAGLHRLTACKLLGQKKIECNVINCANAEYARLAEIDENLIRSELDALERAELWLERDRILEQLGLRAKTGDNQYTIKGGETVSPPIKTTIELAKEAGFTDRTYQQGKQIAKNIAPEVKEIIKGTPLAKSTTTLLKVARAGSKERQRAEQAEQEAKAKQEQALKEQKAKEAAEARAKQRELQLLALKNANAEKQAKLALRKGQRVAKSPSGEKASVAVDLLNVQSGDQWLLDRHLVYCGNSAQSDFINYLPSNAALALATLSSKWNHDYLINEAQVVAVLRSEGYIHDFCKSQKMPFKYELMLGNIYLSVFSHQPISKPEKPVSIQGIEGIVTYLLSLYTSPGNFVIAPFLGYGEILISCEKMGRVCFAGEENPELATQAIARWQKWTGKKATKT